MRVLTQNQEALGIDEHRMNNLSAEIVKGLSYRSLSEDL